MQKQTNKQIIGHFGEELVFQNCSCPKCKKNKTLKLLPTNFKCADVICDFCGYLAQVKTKSVNDINIIPDKIMGAAWGPQNERMQAGIYFPLYLVLFKNKKEYSIHYLAADLQEPTMFEIRKPLSQKAKRAGWQGFNINLKGFKEHRLVRLK